MKRHNKKSALFLALSLFSPASAAFAQAVDPLLAKLNALPPHERHAALVKGAQSERSVEWYATLPADHSKSILDAFRKHYPFVEVTQTRAGGGRLVNRVATEYRAGLNKFDVLGAGPGGEKSRRAVHAMSACHAVRLVLVVTEIHHRWNPIRAGLGPR